MGRWFGCWKFRGGKALIAGNSDHDHDGQPREQQSKSRQQQRGVTLSREPMCLKPSPVTPPPNTIISLEISGVNCFHLNLTSRHFRTTKSFPRSLAVKLIASLVHST
ncbi:uncharacterized protein LAJ45_10910 [Morchella importuna]|uniref:uncharacterized protein n=1 Tax=Morchella importuna TaxID=1174673 RepID=UPI001E8C9F3D|nr:uncharacterized protein LAJ45_10910 [Morchella importuna]KAH8145130.1 hypothetical protein LAJ45_10910 [Morchella importuna]